MRAALEFDKVLVLSYMPRYIKAKKNTSHDFWKKVISAHKKVGVIKLNSKNGDKTDCVTMKIRMKNAEEEAIKKALTRDVITGLSQDQCEIIMSSDFEKLFNNLIKYLETNTNVDIAMDSISKMLMAIYKNKELTKNVYDDLICDLRFCAQLREQPNNTKKSVSHKILPNINAEIDDEGNTLLHKYVMEERMDMVNVLVCTDNIDVNKENYRGETPLLSRFRYVYEYCTFGAKFSDADVAILNILLSNNANASPPERIPLLDYAIKVGDYKVVELLLPVTTKREVVRKDQWGTDTDLRDPWYINYIFDAFESNIQLLCLLKQHGANLNTKNLHGQSLLHVAMDSLIHAQRVSESGNRLGRHHQLKDYEIRLINYNNAINEFQFLLKSGVDPNATNNEGDTILHILLKKVSLHYVGDGYQKVAPLFLKYGASVTAKNNAGETPLSLEKRSQSNLVCSLFRDHQKQKQKEQVASLKRACLFYFSHHQADKITVAKINEHNDLKLALAAYTQSLSFFYYATAGITWTSEDVVRP